MAKRAIRCSQWRTTRLSARRRRASWMGDNDFDFNDNLGNLDLGDDNWDELMKKTEEGHSKKHQETTKVRVVKHQSSEVSRTITIKSTTELDAFIKVLSSSFHSKKSITLHSTTFEKVMNCWTWRSLTILEN